MTAADAAGPPAGTGLPGALAEIVEDFRALPERERLTLLLDFSRGLAALPQRLLGAHDRMEPVPECQSPIFLLVEVEREVAGPGSVVRLYFDAPAEAPTTRGFAAILADGLDGLTVEEVLAVPDDVPNRLGLTAAVSPLRLRGMAGMLYRIKRQVREKSGPAPARPAGAS